MAKCPELKKFPHSFPDFILKERHRLLLLNARLLIEKGEEIFVCEALRRAYQDMYSRNGYNDKLYRALNDLRRFIRRALAGDRDANMLRTSHATLGAWQRSYGVDRDSSKLRKDRIKWITFLLRESRA